MKRFNLLSLVLIFAAVIGFNSCQDELNTEEVVKGYTVLLDESADTKAYVSNSGTVSGTGTYTHGSNVSLTTTAQKIQYRKESSSSWSTSTGNSYTINAIDANYYVRPWTQYYKVTVSGGTGGGDVKSGGSCSINAPSSSDPSGKTFEKWTISGTGTIASSTSRSTTVTGVGSDCTVTANFKAVETQTYTITVKTKSTGIEVGKKATVSLSVSGHNSMNPNTSQIVASSTSVKTWTITANKGATVTITASCDNYGCGFEMGGSATKTFSNLSSNQSATIYINY